MIALNNVYKTFETRVSVILENTKPVYFVWCVFAGICLNLLLQICMNPVFYRDSTFYYQMAQSFSIGDWKNAFVLHLPVLYPSLAGIFVCCGIPSMPSMLLVSGIFYALTVFPLFHLLKQFFSEKYALVGVVLFALHYEAAAYYCAPLLDSGRIFFFTSLMALIFSSRGFSWKGLTLCGICYAALSLVRSEGIILAGMLMAAHLAWLIFQCKERFLRAIAGVFYSVAIMLVFCLPRLWQFYIETGIPALEMRQVNAISQFWNYFFPSHTFAMDRYVYCKGNDIDISSQGFFGNWRFYKNFFTGFFPLYLPFTVWGIVIVLRRKLWDCKYSVLLFLFAAYNLFHFLIEASAGRYFLINCVFALPFTVRGGCDLFMLSKKCIPLKQFVAAALMIVAGILIYKSVFFSSSSKTNEYREFRKALHHNFPGQINLLMIGEERGVGYYLNVNACNYRNYPTGLASRVPLPDILKHGIDSREISYKQQKNIKSPAFFDAILLNHSEKAKFAAAYPQFFQDSHILSEGKRYTLYRIQKTNNN